MRIGVLMIPTDPWPQTVARARHLDALGFDHLWTYDHLSWRRFRDQPWHAAVPWLTGVAAATGGIGIGTMVTSPNFRHPVTLAKDAMTLDHVSGGRLTLGIGAGGVGFDATVLGGAVLSPGRRVARLGDFLEALDGLLRNPEFSVRNDHYTVADARMIPGCVQRPRVPLAVAAAGPKTLALAARYGDAWVTFGDPGADDPTPESTGRAVREQAARLDDACVAVGRDPGGVRRIFLTGNTSERPLAGLDAFTDFVGRYGEAGFTDIVFHDPRPDDPVWNDDPEVVEQIAEHFLSPRTLGHR